MNYANFQRTISLYKVLKISNIKALKTDSFFEQIFIPILNTLPFRAFFSNVHLGKLHFRIKMQFITSPPATPPLRRRG